jgi:hypothetical protein
LDLNISELDFAELTQLRPAAGYLPDARIA